MKNTEDKNNRIELESTEVSRDGLRGKSRRAKLESTEVSQDGLRGKSRRIELEESGSPLDEFRENEYKRGRKLSVIPILAIILVVLFICSLLFIVPYDEFEYSAAYIFKGISRRFSEMYQLLLGNASTTFTANMFKYMAAALAGAALAACGTVMQGSFRNVLAGPSSMGAMSGGTLGCLVYVLLFPTAAVSSEISVSTMTEYFSVPLWERYGQSLFTLGGCLLGTLLIMGISLAAGGGRINPQAMVVSGSVFSHLLNTCFMVVQYYILLNDPDDERITTLRSLMMGSFDNISSWQPVVMMAVPIIICLVILLCLSGKLNLLSMDADSARSMGLDTGKFMVIMVVLNTILTSVVISFCGQIGFLGFMLPLIGRKIAGPNLRKLLPVSILLGACMMILFMDVASAFNKTDSLNLFTSLIGTAVMLIVMIRSRIGGDDGAAFERRGVQGMGR